MQASQFQYSLTSCDIEHRSKVTKVYSVLFNRQMQMIHMSMFDHNQSISAGYMMKTRHFSTFFDLLLP